MGIGEPGHSFKPAIHHQGLLSFEKPKKLHTSEEHAKMHSSDCGVPGTYVPNMSDEDMARWKAKHINKGKGGKEERVEIRKTFKVRGNWCQVLLVCYANGEIDMSMNAKLKMTSEEYTQLNEAIYEAFWIMRNSCTSEGGE